MARDTTIERLFTTADDALQGLWGLHSYIGAAVVIADPDAIKQCLPSGTFQMTHEWRRRYDRDHLLAEMATVFDAIHCRHSLLAMAAIFEAAISRTHKRVSKVSARPAKGKSKEKLEYKEKLTWAFQLVKDSRRGSKTMLDRLPDSCGDVDNARRLRNCIVHNNGSYDGRYLTTAINDGWTKVKHIQNAQEHIDRGDKILITTPLFEGLLRSHIELLHILHNTIQFKVFGHDEDYNYAKEQKIIEWHRILSGNPAVGM